MSIRFFLRRRWLASGAVGLALLCWSSWEEPSLHEYAPPTEFITLNAPGLQPGPQTLQLQAQATALPGVTACAIRPDKQLLTLAYNPDRLTAAQVCEQLALRPLAVTAPDPTARECPVPPGYVLALERLRFALNLRRLFVSL